VSRIPVKTSETPFASKTKKNIIILSVSAKKMFSIAEGKYYAFRGTYLRKKGYLVVNEILICNPADNSEQTLLKPQEPLSIGNALKHLQKIFNKDDN